MKPVEFKQVTHRLGAPEGMKNCGALPVASHEGVTISCWELSFRERMSALFFGKLWLQVHSGGKTQPPVAISIEKNLFY